MSAGAGLGLRIVAACATAVVTACSGPSTPGGGEPTGPRPAAPRLSATFTQWPAQVGRQEGLLRLTNPSGASVKVLAVGLDLPQHGGSFLQADDTVIPPGRTLDFRLTLPPPRCDGPGGPIRAVVRTVDAELVVELPEPGRALLRRLGRQACDREVVEDAASLRYAGDWRLSGRGSAPTVVGHLLLRRRDSESTVVVTRVDGSVLYGLTLGSGGELPSGSSTARVEIRLRPLRCDEHARSQATAPFNFRATVRVDGRTARVPVIPTGKARTSLDALLGAACRRAP